ncbi:MAG TPA: helix-turn-helix domain-containing protein [Candidatus Fusicatenibacter intestinipullorum]|nr:helix-turn-helix transcriptional regulator [Phascolarctobacterium faecium]MDM8109112.1 helix-turn-helix transcriptional regulator [Phascolarctobacterium faecium]HJA50883.1 helix-turn-helix domain-containing protein [Candidatus Fusicatenibacter intestinipullorum]
MYEDFVANRIMQLRQQKKVSAREMSLAIGQNVNYINRIENKLSLPSLQGLFYICEYFNITPQEFFEGSGTPLPAIMLLHEATHILSTLNEEQLSLIIAVAKAMQNKK